MNINIAENLRFVPTPDDYYDIMNNKFNHNLITSDSTDNTDKYISLLTDMKIVDIPNNINPLLFLCNPQICDDNKIVTKQKHMIKPRLRDGQFKCQLKHRNNCMDLLQGIRIYCVPYNKINKVILLAGAYPISVWTPNNLNGEIINFLKDDILLPTCNIIYSELSIMIDIDNPELYKDYIYIEYQSITLPLNLRNSITLINNLSLKTIDDNIITIYKGDILLCSNTQFYPDHDHDE